MIPLIIATSDSEFMIVSTGACTDDDTDKTPTWSRVPFARPLTKLPLLKTAVRPLPLRASTEPDASRHGRVSVGPERLSSTLRMQRLPG